MLTPDINYAKINNYVLGECEVVPSTAVRIDIDELNLKHLEDTDKFNVIPELAHGLDKLLDGKLYQGNRGIGDIPQDIPVDTFSKMVTYRSPKNDPQLI